MQQAIPSRRVIRFGVFDLDLGARQLRKNGLRVKLQDQPFEILTLLVHRRGDMVTREELRQKLWPVDTFVDFDHSLNTAIKRLREALDDSAESPRFIETLPRHGYRFIAPLEGLEQASVAPGARRNLAWYVWRVGLPLAAVLAVLLGLDVGGWRNRLLGRAPATPIHSIAVLPLENLSHDPEQEYFADGMTEALITDLAKIGALQVVSRTSAMRYKGTHKPLPEIARELKVDAVVEGAVLRSGNRVRITAQLIHVATDRHLWAETYERDLTDILALQSQVARNIAERISVKLTPQEQQRLGRTSRVNPEAYEAYLKGRYLWNRRNEQTLKKSVEYFNLAIGKEPTYALAYAGLADSYNILGNLGFLPPREAYPRAKEAATKALELDSMLGEAHTALALASLLYDWSWPAAEEEFKRAIELSPNYGPTHQWYAVYLMSLGRHDAALAETERAEKLDPLSLTIVSHFGWVLYNARRYDEAIERCRKALEMDPNFPLAHIYLARAYVGKGMYAEAVAEFEKASPLLVTGTGRSPELGYVYAVTGKRSDALREVDQYKQRWKRTRLPGFPLSVALTYTGLGEKDQAFLWLQKAYEEHYPWLILLKVEPRLDPLRSDLRFGELLRRVGFPP